MEGKKVLIIFEDGARGSKREGLVTRSDEFFIELDDKDLIPRSRVIRVEVLE